MVATPSSGAACAARAPVSSGRNRKTHGPPRIGLDDRRRVALLDDQHRIGSGEDLLESGHGDRRFQPRRLHRVECASSRRRGRLRLLLSCEQSTLRWWDRHRAARRTNDHTQVLEFAAFGDEVVRQQSHLDSIAEPAPTCRSSGPSQEVLTSSATARDHQVGAARRRFPRQSGRQCREGEGGHDLESSVHDEPCLG